MEGFDFKISPAIQEILDAEIAFGNSISEFSTGWPKENSSLIIMNKPFHKKYTIPKLKFIHVNDIHYWKEEYHDAKLLQSIACKF